MLLHDIPVGIVWMDLSAGGIAAADLAGVIADSLGSPIVAHLRDDAVRPVRVDTSALVAGIGGTCSRSGERVVAPLVSVVLATRGRPASLPQTLDSLLRSDHPNFEIVVVDNGPDDPRTAQLLAERYPDEPRIRLVPEPRPGLSHARNRGLLTARGDVVVFTDDDVVVRPSWLRRMAAEFDDPRVGCVTGLVEPAELESRSQWWFESAAGFGRGMDPKRYHLTEAPDPSPLFPYKLGCYGTGASMALNKRWLPPGWRFDEALGAGTAAGGGEDLDLFLDVLMLGGTLVYQPAAVCYHTHRSDEAALATQMRGYGRGLTGLLAKRMLKRPRERVLLVAKVLAGVRHALSPEFRAGDDEQPEAVSPYPKSLLVSELLGMVRAPWPTSAVPAARGGPRRSTGSTRPPTRP